MKYNTYNENNINNIFFLNQFLAQGTLDETSNIMLRKKKTETDLLLIDSYFYIHSFFSRDFFFI